MTKPKDPWPKEPPRRADREKAKAERKTIASIPPAGVIRRPLELPPMERVQDS